MFRAGKRTEGKTIEHRMLNIEAKIGLGAGCPGARLARDAPAALALRAARCLASGLWVLSLYLFIENCFPMFRRRRFKWVVLAVLLAGGGISAFQAVPISRPDDVTMNFDMQVVLGGNTVERSAVSHALWLQHPTPILVTGDEGTIERELKRLGIPPSMILHEAAAGTTWENAKFSLPLLRERGATSVVLVTSWFHTVRAWKCFEKQDGKFHFTTASDACPESYAWTDWKLAIKERCKALAYGIAHGINPWSARW